MRDKHCERLALITGGMLVFNPFVHSMQILDTLPRGSQAEEREVKDACACRLLVNINDCQPIGTQ